MPKITFSEISAILSFKAALFRKICPDNQLVSMHLNVSECKNRSKLHKKALDSIPKTLTCN